MLRDAEAMYQRALMGFEMALGPDRTLTLETVNCSGDLYKYHGKLEDTETIHQRVLTGFGRPLGSVFVSPSVPVRDLWTDGRAKSEAADGRTGSNSVGRPSIRRTGDYA